MPAEGSNYPVLASAGRSVVTAPCRSGRPLRTGHRIEAGVCESPQHRQCKRPRPQWSESQQARPRWPIAWGVDSGCCRGRRKCEFVAVERAGRVQPSTTRIQQTGSVRFIDRTRIRATNRDIPAATAFHTGSYAGGLRFTRGPQAFDLHHSDLVFASRPCPLSCGDAARAAVAPRRGKIIRQRAEVDSGPWREAAGAVHQLAVGLSE